MPRNDEALYTAWKGMRYRCQKPTNKDYPAYGGRGIRVCDEWMNFAVFMRWAVAAGWQSGLTLDRINVDGHYQPSNCRWVDRKIQSNNRRVTRRFEYEGRLWTARELYDRYEPRVNFMAFRTRLYKGWSALDALSFNKNERYNRNAS